MSFFQNLSEHNNISHDKDGLCNAMICVLNAV